MTEDIIDLKASKDFFEDLFRYMNSAVFIINRDVRVQVVNESFKRLFQKTEEEVLNELCGNAIGCVFPVTQNLDCGKTPNCKDCSLREGILKIMAEKGEPVTTIIEREFFIGDSFVLKHFLITLKYFEFHNHDFGLIIALDITELEEQRKKLEELNELKNQFLGIAAHDLRNPITAIMNASSILLDYSDRVSDDQRGDLLTMVQNSSEFMLNLVNDLLDVSKIESGKLNLELTHSDYVEFVKECLKLNKLIAKEKNIEVKLEIEKDIPKFQFDKNKIKQVLDNLLSNAIKYSHENTTIMITIKIEKDADFIITKVIDQGQGIPKDEVSELFKEFHKTSVKSTKGEKSTGLGLAIAKKIVEKHNGEIGVESKVGKGSTFYFSLPISK